ncbi:chemotaxis protein CheD [Maridesulfovibrio zosterae]|uniref:chemotaxis protein CheD n=1 Tax=Maridesulfovibrio zosterae TaxID=82171 RepID=UPI0004232D0A|nr:chemotaxis protein CheD [Maridesulfovibrio zosterae]
MPLSDSEIPRVFLHTGDGYIGVKPTIVSTVLGSCVAVSMFSNRTKQGAICHAFLPYRHEAKAENERSIQICRYVDTAIDHLLSSMLRLGVKKNELEVKLFGGATGLTTAQVRPPSALGIGNRNVKAALDCLAEKGLYPSRMDVGGNVGRKLLFATNSGDIWMKRLEKSMFQNTPVNQNARNK